MRDVTRRRNARISDFETGLTARDDESQFASRRGDGASGRFGAVLARMHSEPQDADAPSTRTPSVPGDDRCDTLADPSVDAHRTGAGAPYAANGGRERSAGHKRGAQTRKPSSSRSGVDPFDADLRPESSQTGALQLRRGVSGRDAEWGTHRAGDKGGHSVHDWRHTTYRNAQEPEGGLTHSRLADRRDNGATESSRTGTLAPHAQSASLLPSRAGKRRFDELAEHRPHAATSERYGRAELESGKFAQRSRPLIGLVARMTSINSLEPWSSIHNRIIPSS